MHIAAATAMIDVSMKTAQADVVGTYFDDYRLQSPDDEARSAMGFPYTALPPSPLHAFPSPAKTLHGRNMSFTQRLQNAEALQEATHSRLKANRTAINDAKEARLIEANNTKKENKRMMKEAGIGNVKAPGFEEALTVKARLARIDQAARANAEHIKQRRVILEQAIAEEEEQRRIDAEAQARRKNLVLTCPPGKQTRAEVQKQRLRGIQPLEGADAVDRMATSMATLRELLPRCASDLGWAEKRMEEKRAMNLTMPAAGSGFNDTDGSGWPPPVSRGLHAASRGLASTGPLPDLVKKSASAPSLLRGSRSLMPKPGHTKLYPSMMERFRVIEGHAHRNAEIIQTLKH